MAKRRIARIAVIAAIVLAITGGVWRGRVPIGAVLFGFYGAYLDVQKELSFTRKSQRATMAQCLREFAEQHHWLEGTQINKGDPGLPPCVRGLEINGIYIEHDYVALSFGNAFRLMELRAFRPGITGYGTKKLADGFWYYAD